MSYAVNSEIDKIVDAFSCLRRDNNQYSLATLKATGKSVPIEDAKAVLIHLSVLALDASINTDIVLASWGLLRGFESSDYPELKNRRDALKVALGEKYENQAGTLRNDEKKYYAIIAEYCIGLRADESRLKAFIETALEKYSGNGKIPVPLFSKMTPNRSNANADNATDYTVKSSADRTWGDNSGDENCYSHRPTYTAKEITEGAIGERTAVINSIFDETSDERKFVSVCGVSAIEGNRGAIWQNETIDVEDGEIYTIRMYVHNNNLNGYRAVAEDTKIKFTVPDIISNEQEIRGYIKSSNATPSQYWASVTLRSQTNVFSLEYIEGSCTMTNGATGSKGCKLRRYQDDKYTKIGYKYLDGEFPGGRQYACYISIQVRVKFEAECRIKTTQRIQNNPDNSWYRTTEAEINDFIECQFFYKNTGNDLQENIMLRYVLPDNMEYIPDTTVLYNSKYQTGVKLKDNTVTTSGINIGHYNPQGNAYVRFCVRVVDNNLSDGLTCLINWGAVTINGIVAKDNAQIYVEK